MQISFGLKTVYHWAWERLTGVPNPFFMYEARLGALKAAPSRDMDQSYLIAQKITPG